MVADNGMDEESRIMCYGNLADAYKQSGDFAMSAYYYRKAVFLADSIHAEPSDYIYLYFGLGSVYTNLEDFEQSGYWWDKASLLWDYMVKNDRFIYYNNRGNDYYYHTGGPIDVSMSMYVPPSIGRYVSARRYVGLYGRTHSKRAPLPAFIPGWLILCGL